MVNQSLLRIFRHSTSIFILIAALIINAAPQQRLHAAPQSTSVSGGDSTTSTASTKSAQDAYGKLPTSFIANAGQLDSSVRFEVRSSAGHLFFTPQGVTLALTTGSKSPKPVDDRPIAQRHTPNTDNSLQTNVSVRVSFDGANPNAILGGADQQPGIANFFIGNDPAQWHTNVPTFAGVTYRDLYPGIDLTYNGHGGVLKGTYTVASGADPSLIRWHYDSATATRLDPTSGDLLIDAPNGLMLTEQVPEVWQHDVNGVQHPVTAHYTLSADDAAQFALGAYDPTLPLVIDPGLVYSTYLGGSDDDTGFGIAVDSSGSAYITGNTKSTNFPTTVGAFQTALGGFDDAFVVKLNAAGSGLVYSTYLGGSGSDDNGIEIAVDSSGSAYVTGSTNSADFPTTTGAFQTTFSGGFDDAFVVKLNAAGSGLVYGTYLGGSGDDNGAGIAVDGSSSVYVTGTTFSADFPTTIGAFQTTFGMSGVTDAFVVKLNAAGSGLAYGTYLGGIIDDNGNGIAVDSSGSAYVAGYTDSANFPTTTGAFQTIYSGGDDAFVVKLNAAGSSLVYSTYLGGSGSNDIGNGIAIDSSGSAYVTGYTDSADFPTTTGAFQTTFSGGFVDAFVVKLNAAGSGLVYSTYLGGSSSEYGAGIAVDNSGSAYVMGTAFSADFPTTIGAFQTVSDGGDDAFVVKLNAAGSSLVYSTYLGGSGSDNIGNGIAIDSSGSAYVTGGTFSTDFPTTVGAFQTTLSGGEDAFITKLDLIPLPNSSPKDTIGIFRPSTAAFYLRNSNTSGTADSVTALGIATDLPVVGDWNGDGVDTVGVYRPSTGQFFLTDSNTSGAPIVYSFVLGVSGDVPMAGDWDGDGKDGVGVWRPSNGLIYLKNGLTTGFADFQMVLGIPGDQPVAGDWNFDGKSSPGVYRPSSATFFLTDQVCNCNATGSYQATLGVAGDSPFAGDWNNDGKAGIGVFRPSNGLIYLKNSPTTGFADIQLVFGIANDKPVAGHWAVSPPIHQTPQLAPTFVP
ncbi:MAG: SBBP repeat-containing protein [Chloroflexota bacterium]